MHVRRCVFVCVRSGLAKVARETSDAHASRRQSRETNKNSNPDVDNKAARGHNDNMTNWTRLPRCRQADTHSQAHTWQPICERPLRMGRWACVTHSAENPNTALTHNDRNEMRSVRAAEADEGEIPCIHEVEHIVCSPQRQNKLDMLVRFEHACAAECT